MSVESAKAFIERMKADEDFNHQVSTAKDAEARIALTRAEGFDFSAEDMNAVKSELTEDDLQQINAGGSDIEWHMWTKCSVKWRDYVTGCMSNPGMRDHDLK